ncbi:MAG: SLBB domain-containing protein [Holophagaceae bacterium]
MTQPMRNIVLGSVLCCLGSAQTLGAQTPQDIAQAMASAQTQVNTTASQQNPALPTAKDPQVTITPDLGSKSADAKLEEEIKALKKLDRKNKPRQFAADLFEYRQPMTSATDGGISEDYVLGTGDRLQLNVFGSATFETPVQVDGKGDLAIPKVGVVKVAGLTLKKAKAAVQQIVSGQFSKTDVDLQVIKLREVRISVLGEVYKPGTYLVSSLSSVLNILGLTGGPNTSGSYRDIRIVRGGKVVDRIDLYPLRGEGLGNLNVALQSGDVVFVPLASGKVLLEGAFRRVTQQRSIDLLTDDLKKADTALLELSEKDKLRMEIEESIKVAELKLTNSKLNPEDESIILGEIKTLKKQLNELAPAKANDLRIEIGPTGKIYKNTSSGFTETPEWWIQWDQYGVIPRMEFELKNGESLSALIRWAGGIDEAYDSGIYTRRYQDSQNQWITQTFTLSTSFKATLQAGDILTALPKYSAKEASVQVVGHIRIPGPYAPEKGLRVGDLIKNNQLLLPTTYLARAEITRTSLNKVSTFLSFDVSKAVAGDPSHNLLLEERDVVRFYSNEDLRFTRYVRLSGPLSRAGLYAYLEGMRASDLIFRAGLVYPQANKYRAELSRTKIAEGSGNQGSTVIPLKLDQLISTESQSPVDLKDDALNPLLQPQDVIALFEIPSFRYHRSVVIRGQVQRPGEYVFDKDHITLRDVIARSGGLTDKAFVSGAVFLRGANVIAQIEGLESSSLDPLALGVPDIFRRLSEVKRDPTTGVLQSNPIRFGVSSLANKRLVVDFEKALQGDRQADITLEDGDEIVIPEFTSTAYVIGEVASPFTVYQLGDRSDRIRVIDAIKKAGMYTRNADTSNIRLLKANGQIIDNITPFGLWTHWTYMGPGDTVIIPPRYAINSSWQQDLTALTNLALIYKVINP